MHLLKINILTNFLYLAFITDFYLFIFLIIKLIITTFICTIYYRTKFNLKLYFVILAFNSRHQMEEILMQ